MREFPGTIECDDSCDLKGFSGTASWANGIAPSQAGLSTRWAGHQSGASRGSLDGTRGFSPACDDLRRGDRGRGASANLTKRTVMPPRGTRPHENEWVHGFSCRGSLFRGTQGQHATIPILDNLTAANLVITIATFATIESRRQGAGVSNLRNEPSFCQNGSQQAVGCARICKTNPASARMAARRDRRTDENRSNKATGAGGSSRRPGPESANQSHSEVDRVMRS